MRCTTTSSKLRRKTRNNTKRSSRVNNNNNCAINALNNINNNFAVQQEVVQQETSNNNNKFEQQNFRQYYSKTNLRQYKTNNVFVNDNHNINIIDNDRLPESDLEQDVGKQEEENSSENKALAVFRRSDFNVRKNYRVRLNTTNSDECSEKTTSESEEKLPAIKLSEEIFATTNFYQMKTSQQNNIKKNASKNSIASEDNMIIESFVQQQLYNNYNNNQQLFLNNNQQYNNKRTYNYNYDHLNYDVINYNNNNKKYNNNKYNIKNYNNNYNIINGYNKNINRTLKKRLSKKKLLSNGSVWLSDWRTEMQIILHFLKCYYLFVTNYSINL